MAYTLPAPIPWPYARVMPFMNGTVALLDAGAAGVNSEKIAMIGYWHINGRATSITLDTNGTIGFSVGTVTFSDVLSVVRVGIQGVNTSGPIAQPDGTWGAMSTVTTAANTTPGLGPNDDQWQVAAITTGTSTITHGALGAVVIEMYTAAATPAAVLNVNTASHVISGVAAIFPTTNTFVGTPAWQTANTLGAGQNPIAVLTDGSGTIATFYGAPYVGTSASRTWTDSTNPDERGMLFQVPFDCKVDGIWLAMRTVDGTSDFTVGIYSSPTATRATVVQVAVDATQLGPAAAEGMVLINFTEVSLSANTTYCVAVKATGAGNIRWNEVTLGAATHRAFYPGGTTMSATTANAGGDFAAGTTTLLHPIGVMISQDTTAAGGGGGIRMAGHGGLAA